MKKKDQMNGQRAFSETSIRGVQHATSWIDKNVGPVHEVVTELEIVRVDTCELVHVESHYDRTNVLPWLRLVRAVVAGMVAYAANFWNAK